MAKTNGLLSEFTLLIFVGFWIVFVQTNVSPQLGNTYTSFVALAAAITLGDYVFGKRDLRLVNPNNSWIGAFAFALIGALVVTFGGQLVVKLVSGIPISSVLTLLQSTAPVFSNSVIINFFTFAGPVAYLESYVLFFAGIDLISSTFKITPDRRSLLSPWMWIIIFIISVIFMFYHITAKGIGSQDTLVIVFFMAVVSMIITLWTEEGRAPILMHIMLNAFALLPTLGINIGI